MARLLTRDEIAENLKKLEGWEIIEGKAAIVRTYRLKNFASALQFVNRVGAEAEGMDHHPDIFLHDYKVVMLTLTTHDAKTADGRPASGLTRLDFDLAARIDKAFLDASGVVS